MPCNIAEFPLAARLRLSLALIAALLIGCGDVRSNEADEAKDVAQAAQTPATHEEFKLPEQRTADSLLEFIQRVGKERPEQESPEELKLWVDASRSAIVTASDAVLADNSATEDQKRAAAEAKIEALQILVRFEITGAEEKFREFNESLLSGPDKELAARAKISLFALRAEEATKADGDAAATELGKEAQAYALEDKEDSQRMQLIMALAQVFEQGAKTAPALQLYEFMAATYGDSNNRQVSETILKMAEDAGKRLRLVGNKMDISGTTLDGKPFDWSKYEGKVVLVDFWATWCGPCVEEIPNVLENYKKYHAKGFEVVGITLDDDKASVDAFYKANSIPWPTIYDENAPMAAKYGISSIPAPILVGKDGKVITLSARAEELGQLLSELLGPADSGAEAASDAKHDKAASAL